MLATGVHHGIGVDYLVAQDILTLVNASISWKYHDQHLEHLTVSKESM